MKACIAMKHTHTHTHTHRCVHNRELKFSFHKICCCHGTALHLLTLPWQHKNDDWHGAGSEVGQERLSQVKLKRNSVGARCPPVTQSHIWVGWTPTDPKISPGISPTTRDNTWVSLNPPNAAHGCMEPTRKQLLPEWSRVCTLTSSFCDPLH